MFDGGYTSSNVISDTILKDSYSNNDMSKFMYKDSYGKYNNDMYDTKNAAINKGNDTTSDSCINKYINKSLNDLNNTHLDPLTKLQIKRDLMTYILFIYDNDEEKINEMMTKIMNTDFMKNFNTYISYNG